MNPAIARIGPDHCHLGEGPGYEARTDTAWWFDILERRLYEAELGSGRVRRHELPVMASAMVPVDGTRQIVCAEDGLHLRDRATGALRLLHPVEAENGGTRSNDARVHPCGTLWFSTMGRRAERGAGAIYALAGGRVVRLFAAVTIPNAIAFSADGTRGFFADTARRELYRVPVDPGTGLPAGEPVLIHADPEGAPGLDGAASDREGRLWVARWGGGRVDAFDQEGTLVASVAVPARQASCPVFAGPDHDRLLVTSAWEGQDAAARAADPEGGRTFLLPPAVQGFAEPPVRL